MKEYVVTRKNRLTHYTTEERYSESEVNRAADLLGIPKSDLLKLALKNAKKIVVENLSVEDLVRQNRTVAAVCEYRRANDVSLVDAKKAVDEMIEKIDAEKRIASNAEKPKEDE